MTTTNNIILINKPLIKQIIIITMTKGIYTWHLNVKKVTRCNSLYQMDVFSVVS